MQTISILYKFFIEVIGYHHKAQYFDLCPLLKVLLKLACTCWQQQTNWLLTAGELVGIVSTVIVTITQPQLIDAVAVLTAVVFIWTRVGDT